MGLDTSTCQGDPATKRSCLIEMVYANPYGIRPMETDRNMCFSTSDIGRCNQTMNEADQVLNRGLDEEGNLNPDSDADTSANPALNSAIQLNNALTSTNGDSGSAQDTVNDLGNVASGALNASADGPENMTGNGEGAEIGNAGNIGVKSFVKDINYLGVKSQSPGCVALKKAAIARGIAFVGGLFMVNSAMSAAQAALSTASAAGNVQGQAYNSIEDQQNSANSSYQINQAAGTYAQNVVEVGKVNENKQTAQGLPPSQCATNATTYIDFDEQNELKEVVINNINNSKGMNDIEKNLLEGVDVLLASGETYEYQDEFLKDQFFLEEEEFRIFSLLYIEFLHQVLIGDAYAADSANSPSLADSLSGSMSSENQEGLAQALTQTKKVNGSIAIDLLNDYGTTIQEDNTVYEQRLLQGQQRLGAIQEMNKRIQSGQ